MRPATPDLGLVRRVVDVLVANGIAVALGGSGLLAALGLRDHVRDWDLTTDAPAADVEAVLRTGGILWAASVAGDGIYATSARIRVPAIDHDIDLIIGFALDVGGRRTAYPTRVTETWRGLPLGDPVGWADAYRRMGRFNSAQALEEWVARQE